MTFDPVSFGAGVAVGAVLLAYAASWRIPAESDLAPAAQREPNAYSASGLYLIEHERPGDASPYTVWPVNDKLLCGEEGGFTCATRVEAEALCYVLETGKPPDEAR